MESGKREGGRESGRERGWERGKETEKREWGKGEEKTKGMGWEYVRGIRKITVKGRGK